MLGMGLTLTKDDFDSVIRRPGGAFLGLLLQFTVMPSLGYLIAKVFGLPPFFSAGLILVSCCPGGTASNVITYLARADVALSVSMTALSTITAVVMTPILTTWLVGSRVDVSGWGLFLSTVQVVLIPVAAGLLLREYLPSVSKLVLPFAPFSAVVMITMIVASIIGAGKEEILTSGYLLIAAVFTLHGAGFLLGYLFARLFKRDTRGCRTISIEVGMQNSGLGVVLARQNFTSPAVAIPSAISSLFHSLIGSFLALLWSKKGVDGDKHNISISTMGDR